ncbi:MAG: site-specific integrase [Acetobacteraceae bacterium]|nr:site-specific integrase [Acetobacteraceae bacterium]
MSDEAPETALAPSNATQAVGQPHMLSETAMAYARQALSPATRRAYASHLRAWEAWCRRLRALPAPAAPSLVANHLAELAGTRSYATLTGRLAAIAQAHALLRLPFDAGHPELRKTLQGIARTHGRKPQRQAAPLLTADVIRIASVCGGSLRGERDRALLLLGFAGAFRRSELVTVRVADVSFGPHGVSVLLPRSKSDQEGEGTIVHVAANPLAAHCPVAALRSWLDAAGLRHGWVFRRITRSDAIGRHPLSAEALRLILRERAREAGFPPEALARISPHSLRAGCITTLAQARVHERDIMRHSRHDSQTVMRGYIRAAATEEALTSEALWRRIVG